MHIECFGNEAEVCQGVPACLFMVRATGEQVSLCNAPPCSPTKWTRPIRLHTPIYTQGTAPPRPQTAK